MQITMVIWKKRRRFSQITVVIWKKRGRFFQNSPEFWKNLKQFLLSAAAGRPIIAYITYRFMLMVIFLSPMELM